MKLLDLINESYQSLYCYKSLHRTIDVLKKGYIEPSQYEFSDSDNEAIKKPHICVTRNKNYKNHNDETRINIGSVQELPGSFAAVFVIDGEKVKNRYKVLPFKNSRLEDNDDINQRLKIRYEAEERIMTNKLSLSYVSEVIISDRTNKISVEQIKKICNEKNIKVRVGKI